MARLPTLKPRLKSAPDRQMGTVDPSSWRSGKTTAERGYGSKWQKARERFLFANPLCCYCNADGRVTEATVVDHKVPHKGDQKLFWDQANWQSLCDHCHNSTKRKQEANGLVPGCDVNGLPVDPSHPWS